MAKPYLSYTNDSKLEYEGFSKDLADEIFAYLRELGYNYTHSFDNNLEKMSYGTLDPETKKWTGLIGRLLSKVIYIQYL